MVLCLLSAPTSWARNNLRLCSELEQLLNEFMGFKKVISVCSQAHGILDMYQALDLRYQWKVVIKNDRNT